MSLFFFFFKQKTAYEMRISDWSSDVCSSDLQPTTELHGTSAAIEFAVRTMRVEHVIILGHSQCGGIGALLRDPEEHDDDFVAPWMEIAAPARARALAAAEGNAGAAQHLCEREAIKVSLDNLMTFPWLRERAERGELALHGWHFDIPSGDLQRLDESGEFRRVEGT